MDTKKIKDTILLPKTDFPLRNTNHLETEKKIQELWEKERVYQKVLAKNQTKEPFILHSGPPYANGKIHLGHVLNFLIKDIIIRSRAVEGYPTPFLLGWDTHGLPIEHKMIQAHQGQKVNLRQVCHNFALEQVQLQKEQLKKLGLFTDYDKYYITLDKEYEAKQIRVFGVMVKKGLVYQGFRPIHWSWSHETALAGAEIEYYEKKDTSLYFKIKLAESFLGKENVNLLVWTTQPWTIPANQLIATKKTASYALVNYDKEYLLVLESKVSLLEKWGREKLKVEKILSGEKLLGLTYLHPYRKDIRGYVVAGDEFVKEEGGTGIVHLAPAFGVEDFSLAKKEKLTIECPLEPNGVFNEKIAIPELIGKHYLEVNNFVITDLEKRNLTVKKEVISHSYPHDWRDKSPLIYRLTKQWFIKVESIKKELLENIAKVKWYPAWTQEKMKSAISAREDWCISRQRKWGVPIPVLYKNNEPILDFEVINYVAEIVASRSSDGWFDGSILPLLRDCFPNLIDKETVLGQDIMDVWLDSGVSHWCVLRKNINSESSKKTKMKFFDEKWWKEWEDYYLLIKTEKGFPDLIVLLMNANWEKNKEWICFVVLNTSITKKVVKRKLLNLFFLMRRRDFDYSDSLLKEEFSTELEKWKQLEERIKKEWINFINRQGDIHQFWVWKERNIKFHLIFNKFYAKKNKEWEELETIAKASVAHNFYLLNEIVSGLVINFSEKGKIKKIFDNEEVKLKIEFDVDPERKPDILITSEKFREEWLGIEVVEVYSCSVKNKKGKEQQLINRIRDRFNKAVKESVGKNWEEKIKSIKCSLKNIKIAELREEETKESFIVSCVIPKEVNNINHLMKELNETIKKKNNRWEKKNYKNFGKTALWTVLSATFPIIIKNQEGNVIADQEIKREFFSWFLIKKIQENLSNVEIKFGFLIITFLDLYQSDEKSFLDGQDPLTKERKEKSEEKQVYMIPKTDFIRNSPSDAFLKATIPNLYIPIVNNKIETTDDIERIKTMFKIRFGFDISSLKYEEMPTNFSLKINKKAFY